MTFITVEFYIEDNYKKSILKKVLIYITRFYFLCIITEALPLILFY